MPLGTWAFLREEAIYEYIAGRFRENDLRLYQKIKNSQPVTKLIKVKVRGLDEITSTAFPDIDGIDLSDKKGKRPAEVKFVTSKFNYHLDKRYAQKFADFAKQQGCIVVLRHDHVPQDLLNKYEVDVFELDLFDFISFLKENFVRFLNRQIKSHELKKTWLMIESPNFWGSDGEVLPARESRIWCPTDNLSGFDLSTGDRVIFVKTKGCSYQSVSSYLNKYQSVPREWFLTELVITEVTSPIMNREEYCKLKGKDTKQPLWYDETHQGKSDLKVTKRRDLGFRWKRIFEFKTILELTSINLNLNEIYSHFPEFVLAVANTFIPGRGSQEIDAESYSSIMEFLALTENQRRNYALEYIKENTPVLCSEHDIPILH